MSQLIPAIREGNVEETALTDLLKSQDASGFSAEAMDQWLDGKETEISVVTQHIKTLKSEIKPTDFELQTFLMAQMSKMPLCSTSLHCCTRSRT